MAKSPILLTFIAFSQFITVAFLIICSVTAPVFKQIGLSKNNSITYGVFGYCSNDEGCSKASVSYDVSSLSHNNDNWSMNGTVRERLAKILIVTPIAAGLNFLAFLTSIISAIIINLSDNGVLSVSLFMTNLFFDIVGFLSAALICIVTFLLFFPHMTWCSWLLIPAAVLPLFNLPVICMSYLSSDNRIDYNHTNDHLLDAEHDFSISLDDDHAQFYRENNKEIDNNSTDPHLEKKSDIEVLTQPLQNASTLSYNNNLNSLKDDKYNPTYDIHRDTSSSDIEDDTEDSNTHPLTAAADGDGHEMINNRQSFTAFSAIDNDKGIIQSPNGDNLGYDHLESIASSNYSSTKDLNHISQPANKILEDILNDQPPHMKKVEHACDEISTSSNFTSISQRAVNPNYNEIPSVNNYNFKSNNLNTNRPSNNNKKNKPSVLPYPHSRTNSQLQHNMSLQNKNNHMNSRINNMQFNNTQARNGNSIPLPSGNQPQSISRSYAPYNNNNNSNTNNLMGLPNMNYNNNNNNNSIQQSQGQLNQTFPNTYHGNNTYPIVTQPQNGFSNMQYPPQQYNKQRTNYQNKYNNNNNINGNNASDNFGIIQQSPVHFQNAYKKKMAARNNMQNQINNFNLR